MGWVVSATLRSIYSRKRAGTHCIGGCVGPRVSVDVPFGVRTEIYLLCCFWSFNFRYEVYNGLKYFKIRLAIRREALNNTTKPQPLQPETLPKFPLTNSG